MINLLGLLIAASMAFYTITYAIHVWRKEKNPFGALALTVLALSVVALPMYILYFRR